MHKKIPFRKCNISPENGGALSARSGSASPSLSDEFIRNISIKKNLLRGHRLKSQSTKISKYKITKSISTFTCSNLQQQEYYKTPGANSLSDFNQSTLFNSPKLHTPLDFKSYFSQGNEMSNEFANRNRVLNYKRSKKIYFS